MDKITLYKRFDLIKKMYDESFKEQSFLSIQIKSCIIPAKIMNVLPKKIFFPQN